MRPEYLFFLALTLFRIGFQVLFELRKKAGKKKISIGVTSTVCMYVFYLFIWIWCILTGSTLDYSLGFVISGAFLIIIGILMRILALFSLGKQFSREIAIYEDHKLVTSGIYAYLRHPLYLALLLELAGMILFMQAWFLSPLWLILAMILIHTIKKEDQILEKEFGQAFRDYKTRVRFV